ncbi:MAG: VWA domain-containing protein [Planctomycetota bacterium]|nr:VWA domain-containing protein [Planctomycetota bacterium]
MYFLEPLYFLVAGPVLVWLGVLRRRGAPRTEILFGGMTVFLAVLALAQPVWERGSPGRRVVLLIDVSESHRPVLGNSVDETIQKWVKEASDFLEPEDRLGVMAFGRRVVVLREFRSPTSERSVIALDGLTTGVEITDLGGALEQLSSWLPAGGDVYLWSDGRCRDSERVRHLIMDLGRRGIRIHPFVADTYPGEHDLAILGVDVPAQAAAGERVRVRVSVRCGGDVEAQVRLLAQGGRQELGIQRLALTAGAVRFCDFWVEIDSGGAQFTAQAQLVDGRRDPFPDNNFYPAWILPADPGRVLVLGNDVRGNAFTKGLQEREELDVTLHNPQDSTVDLGLLAGYEMVILEGVEGAQLGTSTFQALRDYVEVLGGGLLLCGGEKGFGAGGWDRTPLETVSPVWVLPRKPQNRGVAVVVILDRSGSMAGEKLEQASFGFRQLVGFLHKGDSAGLIAFNLKPSVLFSLTPVEQEADRDRLLSVDLGTAQGGTRIVPALERGVELLRETEAPIRHLLLLSDGVTDESFETIRSEIDRLRISLSAVVLGSQDNHSVGIDSLRSASLNSGGRFYRVSDLQDLSEIFRRDVRSTSGELIRRGSSSVSMEPDVTLWRGRVPQKAPPLQGYDRTSPKVGAVVAARVGELQEPLVAMWSVGLGRVMAFTSEPAGFWSEPWTRWRDAGLFWGHLISWVRTGQVRTDFQVQSFSTPDGMIFRAARREVPGEGQTTPRVSLRVPGVGGEIPLQLFATDRWKSRPVPMKVGTHPVQLIVRDAGGVRRLRRVLVHPYEMEMADTRPDRELLEWVARETGGRVDDEIDLLRSSRIAGGGSRLDLRPGLAIAGLVILLAGWGGRGFWDRMFRRLDRERLRSG